MQRIPSTTTKPLNCSACRFDTTNVRKQATTKKEINSTITVSCPDYIPDFDPKHFIQRACRQNSQNQAEWEEINVTDIFRDLGQIYHRKYLLRLYLKKGPDVSFIKIVIFDHQDRNKRKLAIIKFTGLTLSISEIMFFFDIFLTEIR